MKYKRIFLVSVIAVALIFISSFFSDCLAFRLHKLGSDWDLNIAPEVRLAYNKVSNAGDMDSDQRDDLSYASYIYNIPITVKYKSDTSFFINFLSEGPSHYSAPLKDIEPFVEGVSLKKNGGLESALYPAINEVWLKFHPYYNVTLQLGQSPYIVGNGYALGGQYNNYGITVSYERKDKATARLRYSLLDFENRIYGVRNDTIKKWDLGKSDDSSAYMLSADITIHAGNHRFQPYVGFLYDRTGADYRSQHGYYSNLTQSFIAKNDKIYTFGLSANLEFPYITLEVEGAKNIGKTESNTPGWDDIKHKGYLIHTALKGHLGIFTPRVKMVVASGNKVDVEDPAAYLAGTLQRTENRAFSVFSPLNTNLVDSFAHKASVPVVAMAGGYPMNYGIRRPGTFNDPHVWENIIAYNFGINIVPVKKAFIMIDFWSLRAKEPGIGQTGTGGSYKVLPKDLGKEFDIYATYAITKKITVGLHGGYFMPGDYYKTVRTESSFLWNNNISQTVRTDGSADIVNQIEVFVTFKL